MTPAPTVTTPEPSRRPPTGPVRPRASMGLERIGHRDWPEAYRCTVGEVALIVVASIGPRILSLRFEDGANLLHEDGAGFRVGDWRLHGGHRFTTAPESPDSYVPDNDVCRADPEDYGLLITQPVTPNGFAKSLHIAAAPDGRGFAIAHRLRNTNSHSWCGALWAITGLAATGRVVVPWGAGTDQWRTQMVRYLVHAGRPYAKATSPQWQPAGDHFVVEPAGERGKIGLYTDRGWLAWLGSESTFVKRCPEIAPEHACPDGGCNAEVFVGPDYVELETLGPLTTLAPGQEIEHVERWDLLRDTFRPEDWRAIETRLAHD